MMTIHIDEIAARSHIEGDDRALLAAAAEYLREHDDCTLRLAPRVYRITDALSRQIEQEVFEGLHGWWPDPSLLFSRKQPYSVGFALRGLKNVRIEATGATLLADGYMEVLRLQDCQNVQIKGFTIDYARRPFSEGRIAHIDADGRITVEFPPQYPITAKMPFFRYSIYDAPRERMFLDFTLTGLAQVEGQTAVFRTDGRIPQRLCGAPISICHTLGFRPAVLAQDCRDICLGGLTIYCQPGNGLLGTRCENLHVDRLCVVPAPGTHFATNTDATHFDSCRGLLRIERSVFRGHGDDAVNVHTFYHTIERLGDDTCRLRVRTRTGTHSQTTDYPRPGDTMELIRRDNCQRMCSYRVLECAVNEPDFSCMVRIDGALPHDTDGLYLANLDAVPCFEFVDNRIHSHIARSVVVKARRTRIEGCRFESVQDAPIEIAAETDWMEGVAADEVIVRGNQFVDCNFRQNKGVRPGVVNILMDAERPEGYVQGRLICEDNHFDCPDAGCAVYAAHAQAVRLCGNSVIGGALIQAEECGRIECRG